MLSTAVAKEIDKNLKGLLNYGYGKRCGEGYSTKRRAIKVALKKSRYVNDKQITDHYAIIPYRTGARSAWQPIWKYTARV